MKLLSDKLTLSMFGMGISAAALLIWLMVCAGVAGIFKVLTSGSGRITIQGMTFQWKK